MVDKEKPTTEPFWCRLSNGALLEAWYTSGIDRDKVKDEFCRNAAANHASNQEVVANFVTTVIYDQNKGENIKLSVTLEGMASYTLSVTRTKEGSFLLTDHRHSQIETTKQVISYITNKFAPYIKPITGFNTTENKRA